MARIKVETVVFIGDRLLIVYYSCRNCYQFSIVDEFECIYDFLDIFYSAEGAEAKGREKLRTLSL